MKPAILAAAILLMLVSSPAAAAGALDAEAPVGAILDCAPLVRPACQLAIYACFLVFNPAICTAIA